MKGTHNNMLLLQQYIKKLHNASGQFNLYMCLCNRKSSVDIKRIKREIAKIKQFVINIENEIQNIEAVDSIYRKNIDDSKNLDIYAKYRHDFD